MAEGIICNDMSREKFSMLTFCEKADVIGVGQNAIPTDSSKMFMKQVYSLETRVGAVIGCKDDRKLFFLHGYCDGLHCSCKNIVKSVFENQNFDQKEVFTMMQSLNNFPVCFLLTDGDLCRWVSCYTSSDVAIQELPAGIFTIQNFTLSAARPEHLKIIQDLHNDNESRIGAEQRCASALNQLHDSVEYWPKAAPGICVGLHECRGQITCSTLDPLCLKTRIEPAIPKPKGPITGFNFFSKMSRKRLLEEMCIEEEALTNNELNRALGQRWKNMSNEAKAPYLECAEQDRKRYKQELEAYKKMVDPTSTPTEGTNRPSKPMTAYNLFVRQEKQFVMGCEVSDSQTRIGKHGGDRWSAMPCAEKDLYMVLRDVGARDYL